MERRYARIGSWSAFFIVLYCLFVGASGCEEDDGSSASEDQASDDDLASDDDDDDTAPVLPEVTDGRIVVPGDGLPDEIELQQANNNLDVARHEGRVFLAWRTAPSHFASERARLYVVSSTDETTWDLEATFHLETDLREPRLLAWDGRLFLYFAVLGTNPLNFEPGGMMATERLDAGEWTEPAAFYGEGFIPWRAKVIDDVPYLLAYVGGESIYSMDPKPIEVHWLTTENGFDWTPVVTGQPVVLSGGSSETDFEFLADGSLVAVSRCEAGDPLGFGMKICRASAHNLGAWQCRIDPRKYDSPLMFTHEGEVYLIGRRNLSETGNYDLGYDTLPDQMQYLLYELDYWITPKRTALWRIDPDTSTVEFVLDFPSRGDTCFPGLLRNADNSYTIYNYTSPLSGPDTVWLLGQLGPTFIVRLTLEFAE